MTETPELEALKKAEDRLFEMSQTETNPEKRVIVREALFETKVKIRKEIKRIRDKARRSTPEFKEKQRKYENDKYKSDSVFRERRKEISRRAMRENARAISRAKSLGFDQKKEEHIPGIDHKVCICVAYWDWFAENILDKPKGDNT